MPGNKMVLGVAISEVLKCRVFHLVVTEVVPVAGSVDEKVN